MLVFGKDVKCGHKGGAVVTAVMVEMVLRGGLEGFFRWGTAERYSRQDD